MQVLWIEQLFLPCAHHLKRTNSARSCSLATCASSAEKRRGTTLWLYIQTCCRFYHSSGSRRIELHQRDALSPRRGGRLRCLGSGRMDRQGRAPLLQEGRGEDEPNGFDTQNEEHCPWCIACVNSSRTGETGSRARVSLLVPGQLWPTPCVPTVKIKDCCPAVALCSSPLHVTSCHAVL